MAPDDRLAEHNAIDWVTRPLTPAVWLIWVDGESVVGVYDSEEKAAYIKTLFSDPRRVRIDRRLVG